MIFGVINKGGQFKYSASNFYGERTNMYSEESLVWPTVVTDELKARSEAKIHEDRAIKN